MVEMLGSVPPVPAAMMYKAKKKMPNCNDEARLQSLSATPGAHGGGFSPGSDTASQQTHPLQQKKTRA